MNLPTYVTIDNLPYLHLRRMDHANRHPRRCRAHHSCRRGAKGKLDLAMCVRSFCAGRVRAHPWRMNIVFDAIQTVVFLIVVSIVKFAIEAGRRHHYLSDAACVPYVQRERWTTRGGCSWRCALGAVYFWDVPEMAMVVQVDEVCGV
ncbi:hypothetical protein ARMSODRAFT_444611 [Armillaria solidipes]|uniref:Uncharacterized protein n=1 Tax=Armillaria solidipes TaxID=1076256 RepID=A0A2H3BMN8_9AGAR|nr:hypothetical protein ARMSODRAFT_444611 [Armillaria solidipes]